jgi:hypothetical protein
MDAVLRANSRVMEAVMGVVTRAEMREILGRMKGMQEWLADVRAEGEIRGEASARAELGAEIERLRQEVATLRGATAAKG